mmetsp:Transcript_10780/g.37767  ORF Transcript_10780/g.37767 Transcript_10780/m.37767 type:complete len:370 (+) Transcript_10780:60-1169(+)
MGPTCTGHLVRPKEPANCPLRSELGLVPEKPRLPSVCIISLTLGLQRQRKLAQHERGWRLLTVGGKLQQKLIAQVHGLDVLFDGARVATAHALVVVVIQPQRTWYLCQATLQEPRSVPACVDDQRRVRPEVWTHKPACLGVKVSDLLPVASWLNAAASLTEQCSNEIGFPRRGDRLGFRDLVAQAEAQESLSVPPTDRPRLQHLQVLPSVRTLEPGDPAPGTAGVVLRVLGAHGAVEFQQNLKADGLGPIERQVHILASRQKGCPASMLFETPEANGQPDSVDATSASKPLKVLQSDEAVAKLLDSCPRLAAPLRHQRQFVFGSGRKNRKKLWSHPLFQNEPAAKIDSTPPDALRPIQPILHKRAAHNH